MTASERLNAGRLNADRLNADRLNADRSHDHLKQATLGSSGISAIATSGQ